MRRRVALGWIGALGFLLALLGPPRPSFAGTLTVHFDLGISAVFTRPPMDDPTVLVQSLGASGSLVLTLEGVNESGLPLAGSAVATLSGLTLSGAGSLSSSLIDITRIERDTLTQNGVAIGVLQHGQVPMFGGVGQFGGLENARLVFDAGQIMGLHDAESECRGSVCARLLFVARPDMSFQNASPFALHLFAVPGDVLGIIAETPFPFRADGGPMTTALIWGFEDSRSFVPEPAELGLLGLAALGAAARRVSRSRRSPS